MRPKQTKSLQSNTLAGWLMSGPALLLITLFLIVPFLLAFWFSFTNQRLISPNPTQFVGTSNFEQLLGVGTLVLQPEKAEDGSLVVSATGELSYPRVRDFTRNNPDFQHLNGMREWFGWEWGNTKILVLARDLVFMKALTNTLFFVAIVAPLQSIIALLLALMINQKLRGINVFRTVYFMPVVVSIVVVSLLWRFIYDGRSGLLNNLLQFLSFGHFQPVDWLGNPDTAMWAIIVMSIWQAVGFHMVIWLAGLQNIPLTLYEAADIEGASSWQKFRFVTWPGLRNTAVLILVVITMQAFALFSQIDVMTNGGPLDSTQTLVFQAVQRGYEQQNIAGGSAISVLLFLIVLTISLVQRYVTRER
ncbi:sugar ABC transporter permease [Devosia sp. Leaf420]|uniref:carbohydrate ABC transporter permease n=1 Tax=Devosia sp. Leaf420 TaxID=1736374 RepID=UPI0007157F38|nr:sugar ABC transporter permease [Devosia sp. Leaf420]KQT46988.1 sugar ABC transporter permease [Devosia sp. Leaf420]